MIELYSDTKSCQNYGDGYANIAKATEEMVPGRVIFREQH